MIELKSAPPRQHTALLPNFHVHGVLAVRSKALDWTSVMNALGLRSARPNNGFFHIVVSCTQPLTNDY
jgi:hypothetical protein